MGPHAHISPLSSAVTRSSEPENPLFDEFKRKTMHDISRRMWLHPEKSMLPAQLDIQLDQVLTMEAAAAFKPHNLLQEMQLSECLERLERALPGVEQRRRYELKMADYLQHRIFPVYGKKTTAAYDWSDANQAALTTGRDKTPIFESMRKCRDHGAVCMTEMGDVKYRWPHKCGQAKLCAHEAREEAQRLTRRYLPAIMRYIQDGKDGHHRKVELQYMVISPKNCRPGQLHGWKRTLMKTYSKLNRRAVTKRIVGSIVVQEDPIGQNGEWNVHLNVLMLVEGGYFDWAAYKQAWKDELGHDVVQTKMVPFEKMRRRSMEKARHRQAKYGVAMMPMNDVQVIQDAFVELIKYCCKITGHDHHQDGLIDQHSFDLDRSPGTPREAYNLQRVEAPPMYAWPPTMFWEWYQANRGFRRTRSYGVLYRVCDTCGGYNHTAENCCEIVLPDPDPTPIGQIEWDASAARYSRSINSIPAHNFTIEDIERVGDSHLFSFEKRGPP